MLDEKNKGVLISQVKYFLYKKILIKGWLYNKIEIKTVVFLHIRDGSGFIQCIFSKEDFSKDLFIKVKEIKKETSLLIFGKVLTESRAPYCNFEVKIIELDIISKSENYPISNKKHGYDFLMKNRHLWLRSRRQFSILRIRGSIIKAIRDYLDSNNFLLIDSPIFTPNICESGSSLFKTRWFNNKVMYLSQSGQLYQESACMAFRKTYSFGPTFRAEKSKTRRHLNEFWMIEPEVAFMNFERNIKFAENFLEYIVQIIIKQHEEELLKVLKRDLSILRNIRVPFFRISYNNIIKIIKSITDKIDSKYIKNLLKIEWGSDLGSPHETEDNFFKINTPILKYFSFPHKIISLFGK